MGQNAVQERQIEDVRMVRGSLTKSLNSRLPACQAERLEAGNLSIT